MADLLCNDRTLLQQFREGRREALMAVWQHYYPLVRSLAVRGSTGHRGFSSPADVDDAISATFLAAFQESARLSYDGITPYGAFLVGIGRNVMRRIAFKNAREPVLEPCVAEMDQTADPSPEQDFLSREESAVLARFQDGLTPEERDVLCGYYRDGLSEERLAEGLCRTRYQVRKTLARVEKRLRIFLRRHGMEE